MVLARFLTPEWFEELNRATACPVPGEGSITIQQVVTGGPQDEVAYVVRVSGGRLEVSPGRVGDVDAPHVDATISADYDTALALSRGELSARAALLAGRIKVRGDTNALLAGQAAMQAAQAAVDEVRARTSY